MLPDRFLCVNIFSHEIFSYAAPCQAPQNPKIRHPLARIKAQPPSEAKKSYSMVGSRRDIRKTHLSCACADILPHILDF
jgi:hypothetical protein